MTVVQMKKTAAAKPKSRGKAPEKSKPAEVPAIVVVSAPADSIVKHESVIVKMPDSKPEPLVFVDGVERTSMSGLNPDDIAAIYVLKDKSAMVEYGERGRNGVIKIELKKANRSSL